ncbi:ShET2/EspL2 family type III secretion system effector toxin [Pseudescherichia vulneris]
MPVAMNINPARAGEPSSLNDNNQSVAGGISEEGITRHLTKVANSQDRFGGGHTAKKTKTAPYFSDKRNTMLNLNGQTQSESGQPIVCRHLAHTWGEMFTETTGKVNYSQFATPEALQNAIPSPEQIDVKLFDPAVVSLAGNAEWGRVFAGIFDDMEKCGDNNRVLTVNTTNHTLACGLKFKDSPEGKKCVIQFYDPNHTVAHKRAVFYGDMNDCRSQIEKLAANDFLTAGALKSYRLRKGSITAFLDRHVTVPAMTLSRLPDTPLHPEVFHHCLKMGLTDGLQLIADRLNGQLKSMPQSRVAALLAAKSRDGNPGLQLALQDGHADAVRVYCQSVLEAGLPNEVVAELLAAKCRDGHPGLSIALQNGHADAARVFCQSVLEAGLPKEEVAALLAAKRRDGNPGLQWALEDGHADAVRVYCQSVLAAGFPKEIQANLLAVKRDDGVYGLRLALQNGHADAIRVYCQSVLEAGLPKEEVAKLVANCRGGLYVALRDGHADAIRAYGDILKAGELQPDAWTQLLLQNSTDGLPGLRVALQNGDVNALRVHAEVLRIGGFPAEAVAEEMALKNNDGIPLLYQALQDGDVKVIRAYGEYLKAAELPAETMAKLLAAKNGDGHPFLYEALKDGNAKAIRDFAVLLKEIGLPPEKLAGVLTAKRGYTGPATSGLYQALRHGNADAIRAYGRLHGAAGFQQDDVVSLLINAVQGQSEAFERGDDETTRKRLT